MAAKEKREGRPDAEQETVTVTSCVELANNAAEKVAELRDAIQTLAQTTHFRVLYDWNSKWDERAESQKTRYIYLIRHGRYVANSSQGESLSPCGMRQAELTGIRICQCTTGRNVRKIVYSCMSRASQTAFTMARHLNVHLERSEDLIEGHPANEVDEKRMEKAFKLYFHRAEFQEQTDTIDILVCHANVIRYFICRALQLPIATWECVTLANCSVTIIKIKPDGIVKLECAGSTGHLPVELVTFS